MPFDLRFRILLKLTCCGKFTLEEENRDRAVRVTAVVASFVQSPDATSAMLAFSAKLPWLASIPHYQQTGRLAASAREKAALNPQPPPRSSPHSEPPCRSSETGPNAPLQMQSVPICPLTHNFSGASNVRWVHFDPLESRVAHALISSSFRIGLHADETIMKVLSGVLDVMSFLPYASYATMIRCTRCGGIVDYTCSAFWQYLGTQPQPLCNLKSRSVELTEWNA